MTTQLEMLAESELADLLPVVQSGDRLRSTDCLRLWKTADLTSLGVLANHVRERASGNRSFFRSTVHLNPTGRPDPACPECAVSSTGRPLPSVEALSDALRNSVTEGVTELHLTGGPDPGTGVDSLCRWVEKAVESFPRLSLRAFTWRQLECAATRDGERPDQVLARLADAGLASPAGGALVDLEPERPHLDAGSLAVLEKRMPWLQAAGQLNMTTELSWVFGDGDDAEVLTDLLVCLRGIQDSCSVFDCFAPISFYWPSGALDLPVHTGYNHLRTVAIGRLFLDNVPRIRSSPFAVGEPLAQVAQWYGADDAGTTGPDPDRMIRLLRDAGRDPVKM